MANNLHKPTINAQIKADASLAQFSDQKVLMIGQAGGIATAGELAIDTASRDIETLFGDRSMVTLAFKKFRKYNNSVRLDVVPIAEPSGGAKARGTFTVIGNAKENATLKLKVGDDEYPLNVDILKDETQSEVAANINSAINGQEKLLDSSIDTTNDNQLNIDFFIKGAVGNNIRIRVVVGVAGLIFNMVKLEGGAGTYDVTNILDPIRDRYQTYIFDASMDFDTSKFIEWLDGRFNQLNEIAGGSAFFSSNMSYSEGVALGKTFNSRSLTILANTEEMRYTLCPLIAAAELGAKRSLRLTEGANIGDLVSDPVEAIGGISKASLPYHNTPMSYDPPVGVLSFREVEALTDAGISLMVPSTDSTVLGDMVTTYKYATDGTVDNTFKSLNSVDTSFAIQEYFFNQTKKDFAQTRATSGEVEAGYAMTNHHILKAFIKGYYTFLAELALVKGGDKAVQDFTDSLSVTLNEPAGVYFVYFKVNIMSQLK